MKSRLFILMLLCLIMAIRAGAQGRLQRSRDFGVEDQSEVRPGENIDEKIRKNFFLRAEVTKDKCFAGENIMATFKAYSRLEANSQVLKRPSLSGFSVTEMVDAYSNQPDIEKFNGNYYYVHLIRKVQLFPIQAGDFEIEPAEVESIIQLRNPEGRNGIRSLFRRRHDDPELRRQLTFRSPTLKVHVDPLPEEGQPGDFSGAVGNFSVQLVLEDSTVDLHEPVNVKLMIGGSGNFPLITDPAIVWPQGVQVSGPVVAENTNKYVFPLSGFKTFEYTLSNNKAGVFTIPPVKFSFFDPSSKSYKTVETLPTRYAVSPNERKKDVDKQKIITNAAPAPLQFYYFGVIAVIIVSVIIFLALKKPRQKK
jgi:hypothetical protein